MQGAGAKTSNVQQPNPQLAGCFDKQRQGTEVAIVRIDYGTEKHKWQGNRI
jgi:hypothetical protein